MLSFRESRFEEIRACSPGPPTLVIPLHIGFQRIGYGTDWVSENSTHRKFSNREDLIPEARFPTAVILGN
jgi:hypothetical protein